MLHIVLSKLGFYNYRKLRFYEIYDCDMFHNILIHVSDNAIRKWMKYYEEKYK